MELILILVLIVLVIGPERTVSLARKAGRWLRVLRVYIGSMTEELRETVVEPLEEMQEPLREIAEPFNEISREVTETVNDISKPFEDVANDVRHEGREIEAEAQRNLSMSYTTGSEDKKSSAGSAGEPDGGLEMAEIIEDDPTPQSEEPAIADIEEAGGNNEKRGI